MAQNPVNPSPKKQQAFNKNSRWSSDQVKQFLKTDRAILMICISIAFVFWLMTKLSYSYKDSIRIELAYETDKDKVFTFPPADFLEVDIEGKGWDLLGLSFSKQERVVTIPVGENETRSITGSSLNNRVMKYMPNVTILNIYPENIDLKIEKVAVKTIPVKLEEQIQLAPLYQFVDSIRIEPQFIEIRGPASVIRDIHEWKTTVLIPPNKVDKDIDVALNLESHRNNNIVCSETVIKCFAAVEEVTEKEIEVPIKVYNAPDSLLLVILPKKITVSCRVGLSDYSKLNSDQFEASVDFKNIDLFKENAIRVLLKKKPNFVKQVKYQPKKVDYIIRSRNLQ